MLGRQVGSSLLRLPRCTRLPIRSIPHPQYQYNLAIRTLSTSAHRYYAEVTPRRPGRPKKAVGEPSRPVKRAVKRAAKSPKEDAATEKTKARKETAQKKKTAAKKSPKKKTLSEEEKAKKAERLVKQKANKAKKVEQANIDELKRIALDAPKFPHPPSTYALYLKDKLKGALMQTSDPEARNQSFGEQSRRISEEYRNITPAEKEVSPLQHLPHYRISTLTPQLQHYNHLRHTTYEADMAAYKRFVQSHSAEEIEAANKARLRLRNKLKDRKAAVKKYAPIQDERGVKRPMNAYSQFVASRFASGDFRSMAVPEAAKLIGQEWHALAEGEKKVSIFSLVDELSLCLG